MSYTVNVYEWDYESLNSDGDIVDHNHRDELWEFSQAEIDHGDRLVLVRDELGEGQALVSRCWAYVEDGKLDNYFRDSSGNKVDQVDDEHHEEFLEHINGLNQED